MHEVFDFSIERVVEKKEGRIIEEEKYFYVDEDGERRQISIDSVLDAVYDVVSEYVNEFFWPAVDFEELSEEEQEELAFELDVLLDAYKYGISNESELEVVLSELIHVHNYTIEDFLID